MKLITENQSLFQAYCQTRQDLPVQTNLLPDNWLEKLQQSPLFQDESLTENTQEYKIVFESFNVWSSFKEKLKFKGHDSIIYYDKDRRYIGLSKKVLEEKELYDVLYKEKFSLQDFSIQAIFHEIGHLIHYETMISRQKKYQGEYLATSVAGADEMNALLSSGTRNMIATQYGNYMVDKRITEEIRTTALENFAELFSMAAITVCTSKENAMVLLENMYHNRLADEKKGYTYQLSGAMGQFLVDFKNGMIFDNLSELKDYIATQTQKTLHKQISEIINDNHYREESLFFMGVLNKAINAKQTQINSFCEVLEQKWNIKTPKAYFSTHTGKSKIDAVFYATSQETEIYYTTNKKAGIKDKITQMREESTQNNSNMNGKSNALSA